MSRRVIDERDALRRTVSRQDARIRELEAEARRLRTEAQGVQAYKEDLGQHMRQVLREYPIT